VPTAPPRRFRRGGEAARLLANAERPVIVADQRRAQPNGISCWSKLAEPQRAVIDRPAGLNFLPRIISTRPRAPAPLVGQADVLIGLELTDFWNTVNAYIDNGENLREPASKSMRS